MIKLANFLGYKLTEKQLDLIVENSSFSELSEKLGKYKMPGWRSDRSPFFRKGEIGNWQNYFTPGQSDYIDKMSSKYLDPLGITFI